MGEIGEQILQGSRDERICKSKEAPFYFAVGRNFHSSSSFPYVQLLRGAPHHLSMCFDSFMSLILPSRLLLLEIRCSTH